MTGRGKSKFADYVLYYRPNIPIAIVEAKDNHHAIGDGMQQALEYAEILHIPFVFSSNGDGFVCTVGQGHCRSWNQHFFSRGFHLLRGCGRFTEDGRT
jgi:type I site-specific restriction endonuclease